MDITRYIADVTASSQCVAVTFFFLSININRQPFFPVFSASFSIALAVQVLNVAPPVAPLVAVDPKRPF